MNNTAALRNELTNQIASGDTPTLAACLLKLDGMASTETNRRVASGIIETLAARHPEVLTGLDAWSMDLDTDLSIIEATVASIPMAAL